ncbi:hypothetical protein [Saccharopolyspora phatthalungensis]|uniref:Uncharacterized protein n=1 Tax=Saccharopolyspora phatthalungensis TaxID=664693 RepID=A0A840QER5_9PSEU|nr:hypothetical protein [Saccharopolyspora phatthalungensis]MBB5159304.1 hypothetical protein [Saccharopolyspora phatthalungensis]
MTENPVLRDIAADHPDAAGLMAQLEHFQLSLYGHADPAWVDAAEFTPPRGLFVVAYLH